MKKAIKFLVIMLSCMFSFFVLNNDKINAWNMKTFTNYESWNVEPSSGQQLIKKIYDDNETLTGIYYANWSANDLSKATLSTLNSTLKVQKVNIYNNEPSDTIDEIYYGCQTYNKIYSPQVGKEDVIVRLEFAKCNLMVIGGDEVITFENDKYNFGYNVTADNIILISNDNSEMYFSIYKEETEETQKEYTADELEIYMGSGLLFAQYNVDHSIKINSDNLLTNYKTLLTEFSIDVLNGEYFDTSTFDDVAFNLSMYMYLAYYGEVNYDHECDTTGTSGTITDEELQQKIEEYITNNNYHSNSDYLNYGETKYQEGIDSVDITSDNLEYASNYITENNYHTHEEYLNMINDYENVYNGYLNYVNNELNFTNDNIPSDHIFTTIQARNEYYINLTKDRINDYNEEQSIKYISNNNYHSNSDYLSYGETKYQEGIDSVDITSDNLEYASNYITENNYRSNSEYISYGNTKFKEGESAGYQQATDDGKVLGNFLPTLLGGFGSLFLTIFNIDVLGINLLSIFGIAITIGIIILILKFMRG